MINTKSEMRLHFRNLRKNYKSHSECSKMISNSLYDYIIKSKFNNIAGYIPTDSEVDIYNLMHSLYDLRKTISIPLISKNDSLIFTKWNPNISTFYKSIDIFKKNYDIELVNPNAIIVPGIAFDRNLNRLGFGGNYYDRLIAKYNMAKYKFIGCAFEFQVLDNLLIEKHDQKVDLLITEKNVYINNAHSS